MKKKVELKRRRHKMRVYNNCFTGTDAVDVILHYLLSDKDTFSTDLTREKAVKVKRKKTKIHCFLLPLINFKACFKLSFY